MTGSSSNDIAELQLTIEQLREELASAQAREAVRAREVEAKSAELAESLEYQTAISDVFTVIARSQQDIGLVLQVIVSTATRLVDADTGAMRRNAKDDYAISAYFGRNEAESARERDYWEKARTLPESVQEALATGKVAQNTNIAEVRPDFTAQFGTRVSISVPLLRKDEVLGVLTLGRKTQRPYAQKQIALIETFASQAVIAIENARLLDELQTRQKELQESLDCKTAIGDVLSVISRSRFELQPVMQAIVATTARLIGADRVNMRQKRGDDYVNVAFAGYTAEQQEFVKQYFGKTLPLSVRRVIERRQAAHVTDVAVRRPDYDEQVPTRIRELCAEVGDGVNR
jgi:transcriptional regulator with GAF, ATPase, and Fis domain